MNTHDSTAAYLGNIPSLVTFLPGLSVQERSDIQDVLLDAQLFADTHFSFKDQWSSWMHYYRNRLKTRSVQERSLITNDSVLVSSVEDLMGATFGIDGVADHHKLAELVRRSFTAMGVYQAASAYLEQGVDSGRLGSFQVAPCMKTDSGTLLIVLCSLHLTTDRYSAGSRRLLFFFKGGSYTLSREDYAAHRGAVARYLEGKSKALISSVRI